ncbi:MAG: hypothetical protein HY683_00940 [Chloroflexi bacterium]|nr:hypothetical protein [Chloroflexota bacterium]
MAQRPVLPGALVVGRCHSSALRRVCVRGARVSNSPVLIATGRPSPA